MQREVQSVGGVMATARRAGCRRDLSFSRWASGAGDSHQPRQGAIAADGDVDLRCVDRVDLPAFVEPGGDLLTCDPARTPVARLVVAEAQHVVVAVRRNHRAKAVYEPGA